MAKKKRRRKSAISASRVNPNKAVPKPQTRPSRRRGAVDARGAELVAARGKRQRRPGDGHGVDIGIIDGMFSSWEELLMSMPESTRARYLEHVREHVGTALKPLVKWAERRGASQHDIDMIHDVGPNQLRTVIEFLEDNTLKPNA